MFTGESLNLDIINSQILTHNKFSLMYNSNVNFYWWYKGVIYTTTISL